MAGIAAKAFRKIQFGLDLCEKFSVSAGLLPGEFAVLAADGAVALVFLFRGGQFCFDSGDGDGEVLLGEFTFPDGDDGPGEGVEALEWADTCVLVLPCGRSAHTEAGWCKGRGKRTIVYIPEMEVPELMYKLFDAVTDSIEGILASIVR